MAEIEHGIAGAPAFVVSGRSVDGHAACKSERGTFIPDLRHIAVGDVVDLIKPAPVAFPGGDDEDACPCRHVAVLIDVRRVEITGAVHPEEVTVELRFERFRGVGPYPVFSLDHRSLLVQEVSGERHGDGFGNVEPECHAVVGVDLR